MADITETRRKKILAHIAENGGAIDIGPLHDWSGLKLLATHKPFSDLMEGLTADELVTWDGKIFTLTEAGRAIAAQAPAKGKKKAPPEALAPDPSPGGRGEKEEAPAEALTPGPSPAGRGEKSGAEPAHDHAHVHEHGHSHEHRHGSGPAGPPPEVAYARQASAPPPRPSAPPPPKGLRAKLKARLKSLIGLG